MSLLQRDVPWDAFAELSCFRVEFYACLTQRPDALFELSDALLCADGPVKTLVELSLTPEHRRGHGALYGGLNHGRMDLSRLRRVLAGLPLPRTAEGRLVLAVDVSNWLRPDANTSPDRLFCHTYGRGRSSAQMIPGWPYSFVAALEQGRTSWTAMLDVVRLCPWDDIITVTATQVREVFQRLYVAGQWQIGDPPVLVVVDAGYDVTRLAFLLADLPVELLGRMRSDRVLYFPPPPQPAGKRGRKPKRGAEFKFEDPASQPVPSVTTLSDTTHYGKAVATAWDRQSVADTLPRTELGGHVLPRRTRAVLRRDRLDNLPVIAPPPTTSRSPVRKQRLNPRPLHISQRHNRTNDPIVRTGRPRAGLARDTSPTAVVRSPAHPPVQPAGAGDHDRSRSQLLRAD